jgi:membrane protein implicated in regulation of membrane protease activity
MFILVFTLDAILSLMLAGTSPQSAVITAIPLLVVFIVQCSRWLKSAQEDEE